MSLHQIIQFSITAFKDVLNKLSSNTKVTVLLKSFQILFYIAFVILWFKDNSPILKKTSISYFVPLIPFIILTLVRLTIWLLRKRPNLHFHWNRDYTIIIILLLLATAVRIPFYINHFGILNSDDSMPLLQGKHIASGELPAIYYYGQTRIGSLPFHIYGLLFKLFGYSVILGIIAYFLPFLGFIILQYLFFKAIFSDRTLAFILALFYCLPFRHLLSLSFYIGSNMTYALFLGGLALYLSLLVYQKDKLTYIPVIGICLGLAFWTHPSSIIFGLCSFLFILLRVTFHLRPYFNLIIYFFIGYFPGILFEFFSPQKTFTFLFSGTSFQVFPFKKMLEILKKLTVLVSGEQNFLNFIYLGIIISGILGLIFISLKKQRFLPENIFGIYFLGFLFIYSFSHFPIDNTKLRYLYNFYFTLPFLMICVLNLIRKKMKYVLMLCLFLIMIIFSNIRDVQESYFLARGSHNHLKNIVQEMVKTGEKYWLGTFWDVHLLTALSGEKIIGCCYSHYGQIRYIPFSYMLSYFNHGENNNYVFFKQSGSFSITFKEILPLLEDNLERIYNHSEHLLEILEKLKINAKIKKIGNCCLIYRSSSSILPVIMKAEIPEKIPDLSLEKIKIAEGWLLLSFRKKDDSDPKGFKIIVEIEDFCSEQKSIPQKDDEIRIRVPLPNRPIFKLKYALEYMGAKLPTTTTVRKISLFPKNEIYFPFKRKRHFVYLNGSIPGRNKEERYLKKEAVIEINRNLKAGSKICLLLIASLVFPEFLQYGNYCQEVKIYLNDHYVMETKLYDGENLIEIVVPDILTKQDRVIMDLKFKYHFPCPYCPRKKTSAILKNIDILD